MEETVEALHDVLQASKARYIGAPLMWTRRFQALQNAAETNDWTPFISTQNLYRLPYRKGERKMMPYCARLHPSIAPDRSTNV